MAKVIHINEGISFKKTKSDELIRKQNLGTHKLVVITDVRPWPYIRGNTISPYT